jgi:hypothetical protein
MTYCYKNVFFTFLALAQGCDCSSEMHMTLRLNNAPPWRSERDDKTLTFCVNFIQLTYV